jgi:hypothetical protein
MWDREFKFEVLINGQLLNMVKASYLESILKSLPENKSLLIDIWNVVDNSVRNIIKNGLYKDTTIEKAIINNTFEGYDRL